MNLFVIWRAISHCDGCIGEVEGKRREPTSAAHFSFVVPYIMVTMTARWRSVNWGDKLSSSDVMRLVAGKLCDTTRRCRQRYIFYNWHALDCQPAIHRPTDRRRRRYCQMPSMVTLITVKWTVSSPRFGLINPLTLALVLSPSPFDKSIWKRYARVRLL